MRFLRKVEEKTVMDRNRNEVYRAKFKGTINNKFNGRRTTEMVWPHKAYE